MNPINVPALAHAAHPVVQIENGKIITTSVEVARVFEKRHDHVLDSIKKLLSDLSADHAPNFREMVIDVEIGSGATRKSPAYQLTRDGFTLLAMRFTSKKALAFQVAYIDAFNQMEAALAEKTRPDHIAGVNKMVAPAALPAPDDSRVEKAYALAQQTASMVSEKVFKAAAAGRYNFSDGRWWILVSRCGTQVSCIDPNAAILTPAQFIEGIRTGDMGSLWTPNDLMQLAQVTLERLKHQLNRPAQTKSKGNPA